MRILFIGNSFTYVNDLPDMVKHLLSCETAGVVRGGAYLRDFCNPADELYGKLEAALTQEKWDYAVIQEQSFNAVGNRVDFLKYASILCARVRHAGIQPVFYSTWAYKEGSDKLKNTGRSYAEMDRLLAEAYQVAARENDALLAPVGKYFTQMRDQYDLYWPDGYHPTPMATFLAACVIARTITGGGPLSAWTAGGVREIVCAAMRGATRNEKRPNRQAAFEGNGRFLKGNLHSHTTRSDGRLTPETTIRQFALKGYDFLALTDHNIYNFQHYAPETGMLIIPGMEVNADLPGPGRHCVHMIVMGPEAEKNGFSQDQKFRYGMLEQISDAQAIIDEALNAGNMLVYNHPEWSGTPAHEIAELQGFSLMEIWNSNNVFRMGLDARAAYWDELLWMGRKIYGVAADDAHHPQHNCNGYVMVRAEKNLDSILEALQKGAFYASCGPEIHDFFVQDGVATVLCSPASKVRFRSFHFPYEQVTGDGLTAATMEIVPGTKYIRAEVEDEKGRVAWTNPIFFEE